MTRVAIRLSWPVAFLVPLIVVGFHMLWHVPCTELCVLWSRLQPDEEAID